MQRCLAILFMCGLWVMVSQAQQSQEDVWWTGCDARPSEVLIPLAQSLNMDFVSACQTYQTCQSSASFRDMNWCQLDALSIMGASCDVHNSVCFTQALIFTSAIRTFSNSNDSYWSDSTIVDTLFDAIQAVAQGDFPKALADYQTIQVDRTTPNRSITVARALLHLLTQDVNGALDELTVAQSIMSDDPLIHWARMMASDAQGNSELAALDAAWLTEVGATNPTREALVAPLITQYPLSKPLQNWAVYPTSVYSGGVGGLYVIDRTLEPPATVQLVIYPDAILIHDFITLYAPWNEPYVGDILVIPVTADPNTYTLYNNFDGESFESITAIWADDILSVSVAMEGFEFVATVNYQMAIDGKPDPRKPLVDGERCDGKVATRLANGMQVRMNWVEAYLYNAPNGVQTGSLDSQIVTVLDEMVCIDGVIWWKVSSEVGEGWIFENRDMTYVIHPILPPTCADSLASRLRVGLRARVIDGLGANNLRQEPDQNSTLLGSIPPLGEFTVVGNGVCQGGIWWQVAYNGIVGWTREGDATAYWLEPLPQ